MTATYRLRQGIRALLAFTQPVDYTLAAEYLSPRQLALFRRMNRSEQLHSLNVLRGLLAQGTVPDDLAVAALLHDVGKIRYPLAVWHKTFAVLVRAFAPALFHRWSQGDGSHYWRRAFVTAVQHPAWSAEVTAGIGTSERALWLIAHHADQASQWEHHPYIHLLKRLQAADDAN